MDQDNIKDIFHSEFLRKKSCYVKWHESIVVDDSHSINIDLGSCASVVISGIDQNKKIWFGANHLFKPRDENNDIALYQISDLLHKLQDLKCDGITCVGLFGAGYKENSLAKKMAKKNVMNTLEALSLYDLSIEIFQTGFSQGVKIIRSDSRNSILVKNINISSREAEYFELPLNQLFKNHL